MDGNQFDALARQLSTRRTALGGLVAGLLLPLEIAARGKGKGKGKDKQRKDKGKGKDRGNGKGKGRGKTRDNGKTIAQDEPCWRAGGCIPKKGANVSRCDLEGSMAFQGQDCTGCNASRANLRGANLSGANLTKVNLSGSCLIDANLSGATIANTTNMANAIFCNTTMPNGTIDNSGCQGGTACCPICDAAHPCASGCCNDGVCGTCSGLHTCGGGGVPGVCGCTPTTCAAQDKQCGSIPDTCGENLSCGTCANPTPICSTNVCVPCAGDGQCGTGEVCCNGTCCDGCCGADGSCGACLVFLSGSTHNGNFGGLDGADQFCQTVAGAASPAPLHGTYKAWLSIDDAPNNSPASGRFRRSGKPYRLVNGAQIAANWADLTKGSISSPINVTESGGTFDHTQFVWTNTAPYGGALQKPSNYVTSSCDGWTSASGGHSGWVANPNATNIRWTAFEEIISCNVDTAGGAGRRVYCFQQK